jgi:hypothetical protein
LRRAIWIVADVSQVHRQLEASSCVHLASYEQQIIVPSQQALYPVQWSKLNHEMLVSPHIVLSVKELDGDVRRQIEVLSQSAEFLRY